MHLSDIELDVMERSRYISTGGIDLFWMYWSAPEGATADMARMDLVGKPADEYEPPLEFGQFVPIKPLDWASSIANGPESDFIIIGGVGCGKTLNMVLIAAYYCCMLPNFRYLGTAPLSWQADLSYREFLSFALDYENKTSFRRRITRWIKDVRKRPYPTIEFINGSTMEFKSLAVDASGILTWGGDMIVVDQAEDESIDFKSVISNLGTRLRGQVGGRARLGKLGLMANSAYNPMLWETYDRYEKSNEALALLLTSYDNPYLTKKQLRDIERRFMDKDEARRMMKSERPLPKGKEFTETRVTNTQSPGLDKLMEDAIALNKKGFVLEESENIGPVKWLIPPQPGHTYVMAGDPGQGNPPYRNSGVVMVFDVTDFPTKPASLAAFDWIYGFGSYHPFISSLEYHYSLYHPYIGAFDSTGIQKAFDDLGILDQEKLWMPLNMTGNKMHYVLCLKVLMDRSLIKMPNSIYSIWNQLLMWCMPDKNLDQDIASTLFMIGYILNQLLPEPMRKPEEEDDDNVYQTTESRWARTRYVNNRIPMRNAR
jgi:hypothetical protein